MDRQDSISIANQIINDSQFIKEHLFGTILMLGDEYNRPCIKLKPRLYKDGSQWCCIYGAEYPEGVIGWGNTPDEAMRDFDRVFEEDK